MESKEKELRAEYAGLQTKLQDPSIFSSKDYPTLARRQGQLEIVISLFDRKYSLSAQLADAKAMAGDVELAEMAEKEILELKQKLSALDSELSAHLLPKDV